MSRSNNRKKRLAPRTEDVGQLTCEGQKVIGGLMYIFSLARTAYLFGERWQSRSENTDNCG